MISLLWLGVALNIIRVFLPNIGTWITKLFFISNNDIKNIRQSIKSLKEEQNKISIVDEFAKHARLARKILVLEDKLENENKTIKLKHGEVQSKINKYFKISLLLCYIIIYFKSISPVIILPKQWMLPFSFFKDNWTVGFTSWMAITFISVKKIRSAFTI